jgi:hypothetical protein
MTSPVEFQGSSYMVELAPGALSEWSKDCEALSFAMGRAMNDPVPSDGRDTVDVLMRRFLKTYVRGVPGETIDALTITELRELLNIVHGLAKETFTAAAMMENTGRLVQ